jgi:hypothetical protein
VDVQESQMRILIIALIIPFILTACALPSPQVDPVKSPDFTPEFPILSTPLSIIETSQSDQAYEFPDTPEVIEPQELPSPSPTVGIPVVPEEPYPFTIQVGTPVETANFVDPQAGCNWLGVGGQVFAGSDKPVTGMIVEIGGTLNGDPVLLLALTGDSTVLGPGGYVIKLADKPVTSEGSLWVQLFDLNGVPVSEKVNINTYGGENACERNLIVINYSQFSSGINDYYFPSMYKNGR